MSPFWNILYARRQAGADSYEIVSDDHFGAIKEAGPGDLLDIYHVRIAPKETPVIKLSETEVLTCC